VAAPVNELVEIPLGTGANVLTIVGFASTRIQGDPLYVNPEGTEESPVTLLELLVKAVGFDAQLGFNPWAVTLVIGTVIVQLVPEAALTTLEKVNCRVAMSYAGVPSDTQEVVTKLLGAVLKGVIACKPRGNESVKFIVAAWPEVVVTVKVASNASPLNICWTGRPAFVKVLDKTGGNSGQVRYILFDRFSCTTPRVPFEKAAIAEFDCGVQAPENSTVKVRLQLKV
jgi:hypothetical protein